MPLFFTLKLKQMEIYTEFISSKRLNEEIEIKGFIDLLKEVLKNGATHCKVRKDQYGQQHVDSYKYVTEEQKIKSYIKEQKERLKELKKEANERKL